MRKNIVYIIFISCFALLDASSRCPRVHFTDINKVQKSIIEVSIRMAEENKPIINHPLFYMMNDTFTICDEEPELIDYDNQIIVEKNIKKVVKSDEYLVVSDIETITIFYTLTREAQEVCPFSKYLIYNLICPKDDNSNNNVVQFSKTDRCELIFYQYVKHACRVNSLIEYDKNIYKNIITDDLNIGFTKILVIIAVCFTITILAIFIGIKLPIYMIGKNILSKKILPEEKDAKNTTAEEKDAKNTTAEKKDEINNLSLPAKMLELPTTEEIEKKNKEDIETTQPAERGTGSELSKQPDSNPVNDDVITSKDSQPNIDISFTAPANESISNNNIDLTEDKINNW